MWQVVVAVVITLVIAIPVSALVAVSYRKKVVEAKLGNADEKAREIIDEALKTAEAKKRESLLEVKDFLIDCFKAAFDISSCAIDDWLVLKVDWLLDFNIAFSF